MASPTGRTRVPRALRRLRLVAPFFWGCSTMARGVTLRSLVLGSAGMGGYPALTNGYTHHQPPMETPKLGVRGVQEVHERGK